MNFNNVEKICALFENSKTRKKKMQSVKTLFSMFFTVLENQNYMIFLNFFFFLFFSIQV